MDYLPKMEFNIEAIFKFNNITTQTQNHLAKVYATLASGVVVSLISGVLTDKHITPLTVVVPIFIAAVIAEIVIAFARNGKFAKNYLNPGTFYAYALCFGIVVGSMVADSSRSERKMILGLITNCLIYSLALFSTFTMFALLTVRRTAILFGSFITIFILSLISLFVFSSALEALIGLIMGCLYVIVDTQVIIHKTENGIYNVFTDAKELFLDFVKIFFEVMKVMLKKKEKDN
jgi:hypothetical protein